MCSSRLRGTSSSGQSTSRFYYAGYQTFTTTSYASDSERSRGPRLPVAVTARTQSGTPVNLGDQSQSANLPLRVFLHLIVFVRDLNTRLGEHPLGLPCLLILALADHALDPAVND